MIRITAKIPQIPRVVRSRKSASGTVFVTKRGGISKGVWETEFLQNYLQGVPFGYIGSSYRKAWADKLVEAALREQGLEDRGIAEWLTSGDGRHLADQIDKDRVAFAKTVKEYTANAFVKVTLWNHPDHKGSLADTLRLSELLKKHLTTV